MGLKLENVNKVVDGETHLREIDLDFETGSRNVLLGRTLSGKTTLLRIMAGLDRPSKGKIIIDGQDMTGVSVRKRSIAMVYQQFINYPSLTVYDNIASPLKIGGIPKKELDRRVRETAEMLHLEGMLDRIPSELSGGQQQRTAIARALVKEAQLLLLDEPLVNLDYKLREELRVELQDIFPETVRDRGVHHHRALRGTDAGRQRRGPRRGSGAADRRHRHRCTSSRKPSGAAEVFSDPPINAWTVSWQTAELSWGIDIPVPLTGHLAGLAGGSYRFAFRSNHFCGFPDRRTETWPSPAPSSSPRSTVRKPLSTVHHGKSAFVVQQYGVHPFSMGNQITVFINPKHLFVYDTAGRLVAAPPVAGPSA
jgi:glycerol transport system ATP-binding protein